MSTFCHGVASAQSLDKSGEIVDIKGLDITSLAATGILNYEHKSDVPGQICGKILTAKKIFTEKDCSNEHEKYFWNKTKNPFVYITAELLDDYCQSGKDAAGLFRYDHDKKGQNKHAILGFSVEGSEIPGTRQQKMLITRSIARKVTLTSAPCNLQCVAELLVESGPSKISEDFDSIFKSNEEAITLFKSGEGEKIYTDYLAKKESEGPSMSNKVSSSDFNKTEMPNWSAGKADKKQEAVHYSHPEHGVVSIHKQPSGEFHVKHQGKLAGVGGAKGVFSNIKDAGAHAKKYMTAVSQKKILAPKMQNISSDALMGKVSKAEGKLCELHKARVDEGLSPDDKKEARSKRHMDAFKAKRSINEPIGAPRAGKKMEADYKHVKTGMGMSHVGHKVRNPDVKTAYSAKESAEKQLGRIKKNPQPNLPKSEETGDLKKAIEAGSYNAAPSTLTNGAAYQRESISSKQATTGAEENQFQATKKKDWNKQAKTDYENWPQKDEFEKFMSARMPHLKMGEIRAIGRTIALKKSIDMEKSLQNLILNKKK